LALPQGGGGPRMQDERRKEKRGTLMLKARFQDLRSLPGGKREKKERGKGAPLDPDNRGKKKREKRKGWWMFSSTRPK